MHFVCNFLQTYSKHELLTSQGCAATYLSSDLKNNMRLCSKFYYFFPTVKKIFLSHSVVSRYIASRFFDTH